MAGFPGELSAPEIVSSGGGEAKVSSQELWTLNDPEHALSEIVLGEHGFQARATGIGGQRTVFAQVRQGDLQWWQPVSFRDSRKKGTQRYGLEPQPARQDEV